MTDDGGSDTLVSNAESPKMLRKQKQPTGLRLGLSLLVVKAVLAFAAVGCLHSPAPVSPARHDSECAAGWNAFRAGDLDAAQESFDWLVRNFPQSPQGYFGLGVVCAEKSEFDLAASLFETTIRLDPQYDPAYANLGRVLLEMDPLRPEEARESIQHAIDLNPNNGENHFAMAVYHAFAEDFPGIHAELHLAQVCGYSIPEDFVRQLQHEERLRAQEQTESFQ